MSLRGGGGGGVSSDRCIILPFSALHNLTESARAHEKQWSFENRAVPCKNRQPGLGYAKFSTNLLNDSLLVMQFRDLRHYDRQEILKWSTAKVHVFLMVWVGKTHLD